MPLSTVRKTESDIAVLRWLLGRASNTYTVSMSTEQRLATETSIQLISVPERIDSKPLRSAIKLLARKARTSPSLLALKHHG